MVIDGLLTTFTVACAVAVQPAADAASTEYTVVTVGVDVTLAPVDELKFPEGDHVYVDPPDTDSGADWPWQTNWLAGVTAGFGSGIILTVTTVFPVQPPLEPVTV